MLLAVLQETRMSEVVLICCFANPINATTLMSAVFSGQAGTRDPAAQTQLISTDSINSAIDHAGDLHHLV